MPLHVAALELPARWNDAASALERTRELLASRPAPDVALLPETALTGYVSPQRDFDLRPFAEPLAGPTTRALAAIVQAFDEAGYAGYYELAAWSRLLWRRDYLELLRECRARFDTLCRRPVPAAVAGD